MVIGIDAVLVVIRGIRVTLMRLTMKKIIEHNPRKGIFFTQKYNTSYLLFIYFGFIISPSVISPSVIYNQKKGKTRTCPPLFQFYRKTLISLFYIFINIYLPYDTLPSLDGT